MSQKQPGKSAKRFSDKLMKKLEHNGLVVVGDLLEVTGFIINNQERDTYIQD